MKEGDYISNEEILENNQRVFELFESLVNNGFKLHPIKKLTKFINESSLNDKLILGSSLYTLLISIPYLGKVDFTKTLHVSLNHQTQRIEFKYINSLTKTESRYGWQEECQQSEIFDTFNFFLSENRDWKHLQSTTH